MRLERHVGGMGKARQKSYLTARGWVEGEGGWSCERHTPLALPIQRALHHQLTEDLCRGLSPFGWRIVGYSQKGYARLHDPVDDDECPLPEALRRQARREQRPVRELTYSLFLAAIG